jgi:stearoyl-CoA desaturase (delta-9 desaturase)
MDHKTTTVSLLKNYKIELKWRNIILLSYMHVAAFYSIFLTKQTSSVVIAWIIGIITGFGTTVGSHRLFSHRAFKANNKLKILLVTLQTMAAQEPILKWVRDHRVHHKFTDTDADPYNSRRGFFFSHVGWLLCKKHPEVLLQGKKVDMSDLSNDPILLFQQKYFIPLALILNFIFPTLSVLYLGDSLEVAWYGNIFRYVLGLNLVWCVNSC